MKEIYEFNNFVDLSIDLNKPLNKTHRIKVYTIKQTFIFHMASHNASNMCCQCLSSIVIILSIFLSIFYPHSTHVMMHRAIMLYVVQLQAVYICFNVIVNSFN